MLSRLLMNSIFILKIARKNGVWLKVSKAAFFLYCFVDLTGICPQMRLKSKFLTLCVKIPGICWWKNLENWIFIALILRLMRA